MNVFGNNCQHGYQNSHLYPSFCCFSHERNNSLFGRYIIGYTWMICIVFLNIWYNRINPFQIGRKKTHETGKISSLFILLSQCHGCMMTSSNGNIFRVTGPLCGEFTGHQWIPLTKGSDTKLWCFLWSAPEQTVEQTIERLVIWDAIALIAT